MALLTISPPHAHLRSSPSVSPSLRTSTSSNFVYFNTTWSTVMITLSFRRNKPSHVVRMAPDEEKMTRRSPLDFPIEWERPKPGRRPDIFPQFSPMKTPLPPPLPADPPEEDEEEEEEKKEEEEEEPEKEEPEKEEPDKPAPMT